ncbi:MAG: thioredoxin family protein [Roseibium sp.]|uniref:TlpA family protein disulfide reductase n=1 Tax=Roseibium sp. TaxID=1936156 RepID=UPI001AFFF708|nr:thioredoxin family protein [Roseibium sp.]MBO6894242.1 thioredoxin family protein [Roseibium sp.]MBO6928846.1 thioredoxin family protein [Roseibium sp.]
MKKHRKTNKAQGRKSRSAKDRAGTAPQNEGRRSFLKLARNLAIGIGVVGGTGYVFASNVRNTMHEHDLTRVGNGRATVVQIHDPNCSMCLALQRETRKALGMMEDAELDYVVANIRTDKGQTFANRYGVQHVTLLLFDKNGELQHILEGQRGAYQLRNAFSELVSGRV